MTESHIYARVQCPVCCTSIARTCSGVLADTYDDTVVYTVKGGVTDFCSLECIVRFLQGLQPEDLDWSPVNEIVRRAGSYWCNWMLHPSCSCTFDDHDDPPPEAMYFFMDGFYGSLVDGGVYFCSIPCAIHYFTDAIERERS